MSKIIIFRNTRRDFIFTAEYIQVIVEELVKRGHAVTAYDPKRRRVMDFSSQKCKTILPLPKKLEVPVLYIPLNIIALIIFAIKNNRKYDYATFMYCRLEYIVLARLLFKIAKVNYALIFGNIFRRAVKLIKIFPSFYLNSDLILVPSGEHRDSFVDFMEEKLDMNLNDKTKHCLLPIPSLDELDKISEEKIKSIFIKYDIPEHNITLFLGTCASRNEQHLRIIDSLAQLESEKTFKSSDLTLIFPLTYSESRYYEQDKINIISYAKTKLKNYNCIYLTNYLPSEEYLALLKGSDIFVNVRLSDQFAASLIEALFSNIIVLCGSWLPYSKFITKYEIEILEIDDVSKLSYKINDILYNFEEHKQNAEQNKSKIALAYDNINSLNRFCGIFE